MNNALYLLTFFSVYRMHCDEESNSENSGDAYIYITESFDTVKKYVLYCAENDKSITPDGIMDSVRKSLIDTLNTVHVTSGELKAYAEYLDDLMNAFDGDENN